MVAVKKTRRGARDHIATIARHVDPIELIQASLSSKKVARQSPVLAALHRAVDGALVVALLVVALMAALTLHWQHLWTIAFTRLETTRDLAHRLTDSTAMLERHLLQRKNLPERMVPTKVSNLIYLDPPISYSRKDVQRELSLLSGFKDYPTTYGY